MMDLYALPQEFPGWSEARKFKNPLKRVTTLEQALTDEFKDQRFIPYIQLHEFEALLYCDLDEVKKRIASSDSGIEALKLEVGHLEPEAINEGVTTAPSKRLIKHVPIYERTKVRVGAPAAAAIGLDLLRGRCPHFNSWITALENLAEDAA